MSTESGKAYSLMEIFSDSKRIVIPDLQRDYCWGDTDLAKNFLASLIELYECGDGCYKQVSLGLIYAYENPRNFINIADGQQRVTTIYLLLCVLHRRLFDESKEEKIGFFLENPSTKNIADFLALNINKDIKEPRLRYEVRESTVYFLKDFLNYEVFAKSTTSLSELENKAVWYKNKTEYKSDPSIHNMLKSIEVFDKEIEKISDLKKFACFLLGRVPQEIAEEIKKCLNEQASEAKFLKKLPTDSNSASKLFAGLSGISFVYFDMKKREFGEKMYVIINTRGAPMEPNEHVKPLLIGKLEVEKQQQWTEKWERWQDFFWQNRKKNTEGKPTEQSADEGFNDFLTWATKIEKKTDSVDIFKHFSDKNTDSAVCLLELEKLYEQVKALFEIVGSSGHPEHLKYIAILSKINFKKDFVKNIRGIPEEVLLPLLAFMVRFPKTEHAEHSECHYLFLRRLRKNYFDGQRKKRNGSYVDWRHIIQIIGFSHNEMDVLSFARDASFTAIPKVTINVKNWFNDDERIKDGLKKSHPEHVKEIESWEDHDDFMGDLDPLFKVSGNSMDISVLRSFFETYLKIQTSQFAFSDDPELKGMYLLYDLFYRGDWDSRTVAGQGYCMLVRNANIPFETVEFYQIWKQFKSSDGNTQELKKYLRSKIINFVHRYIVEMEHVEATLRNLKTVDRHKIVQIWLLLEFCYSKKEGLLEYFLENCGCWVACFWEYPYLIKPENDDEYIIGNLLAGTSYYNNKTGGLRYVFPLMKTLAQARYGNSITTDIIEKNTGEFIYMFTKEFAQSSTSS